MKLKNKSLKIIVIAAAICSILYIFVYFLASQLLDQPAANLPSKPAVSSQPLSFFTNLYPDDFLWINDTNLLILKDSELMVYNVNKRKENKPPEYLRKLKAQQISKSGSEVFIKSGGKLVKTDSSLKEKVKFDIPESDHTLIDFPYLCLTNNSRINSPEEIASEIKVYTLKNGKLKELTKIKTTYTVKPLTCNSNQIFLKTAHSKLLPKVFRWSAAEVTNKVESEITELEITESKTEKDFEIKEIRLTDNKEGIYFLSYEGQLMIYSIPQNKFKAKSAKLEAEVWHPLNIQSYLTATQKGNTIKIELKRDYESSEQNTIKVLVPEKPILITPALNIKSFAIITNTGELWIVEK
jgi:hypothetical protein